MSVHGPVYRGGNKDSLLTDPLQVLMISSTLAGTQSTTISEDEEDIDGEIQSPTHDPVQV